MNQQKMVAVKHKVNSVPSGQEKGSVLFFILIGVVLFAALSFVIARSMRSQTTDVLSDRQTELMATDILSYAQEVQKAVDLLRGHGISENEICFYHPDWGHASYNGCSAQTQKQVFSTDGGGAKFTKMDTDWIDPAVSSASGEYGSVMYSGYDAVKGVGTDGGSARNQELLMVFPYIRPEICKFINKSLGLPYNPIPVDTTGADPAAPTKRFTGTFNNNGSSTLYANTTASLQGKSSGCVQRANYYVFYSVLIAR